MQYSFGSTHNRTEAPAFDPSFYLENLQLAQGLKIWKHFPIIPKLILSLPDSLTIRVAIMKNLVLNKQVGPFLCGIYYFCCEERAGSWREQLNTLIQHVP